MLSNRDRGPTSQKHMSKQPRFRSHALILGWMERDSHLAPIIIPRTGAMSHRDGSGKIKPRLKMIAPPSHPFNNCNKGGTSALNDAKRNPDRRKIAFSATVQYVNL